LTPPGVPGFKAACDQTTAGGGWTIFQRRVDGAISFWNRTWSDYVEGFGDTQTSYWLGLDRLHALIDKETKANRKVILRIDLYGDLCATPEKCSGLPNGFWFGEWHFKVAGADDNYRLTLSKALSGNLTEHTDYDIFFYMNNGQAFSTLDNDHDMDRKVNCAQFRDFGGWWHRDCTQTALNGRYGDTQPKLRHMVWLSKDGANPQKNYHIHPRRSEMKLRSVG